MGYFGAIVRVLGRVVGDTGHDVVWCEKAAEARSVLVESPKSSQAMPPALQFLVLTFAGWVNRHQDDLIDYLREENRVLREHLGPRPLRLAVTNSAGGS